MIHAKLIESMETKSHHLSFAKLADLVERRLSADESTASRAHLAACSKCAAQLSRLEQIIGLMRTDQAEDAPPDVISRAVGVFRQRASSAEPSILQRIVAALNFDSRQLAPAFGVRSGQPTARQLLFSAGENDIDLRIISRGEKWVISGQVLGDCAGGQVELQGLAQAAQTEMNALCEFTLPPVPAGNYTLRLRLSDMEVEVPDLNLRA